MFKKNLLVIIFFNIFLYFKLKNDYKIEKYSNYKNDFQRVYNNLKKEWSNIFPDSNRNAGGVQFFYYIYKIIKPNKKDFDIYNKLYCGVSGSLIDPKYILDNDNNFKLKNKSNMFVRIKHIDGSYRCGYYYNCCIPCSSDIMNENKVDVLVEDLNLNLGDGNFNYSVLTIPDPCVNSIIINNKELLPDPNNNNLNWKAVSSFNCKSKKTKNSIKSNSGRIIFAILFESNLLDSNCSINKYKNHKDYDNQFYNFHNKRINNEDNLQKWGMGDIFINLAKKL